MTFLQRQISSFRKFLNQKIERYLIRLTDKKYNRNITNYIQKKINDNKATKRFKEFQNEELDFNELKPFIFFSTPSKFRYTNHTQQPVQKYV